jgi:flagellar FliJ protein
MSEFRFSLQSVLKVRLAERDDRRAELADAQRSEFALQTEIDRLNRDLQYLRTHARSFLVPGSIDIAHLQNCKSCEQMLRREIDLLDQQRREVEEGVEQCHAALIQADQQVRMLEKLSDKQHEEHRRDGEKGENRRLDELGCQSFSKVGLAQSGDFGDK